MADFMSNLWGAIFTPGATPTLLIATNATFGCLQLTLAGLLAATRSIHFVILSILCAGLWWAINWFAHELQQAQEKEAEADRIRKTRSATNTPTKSRPEAGNLADDESTETEVDLGSGLSAKLSKSEAEFKPTQEDEQIRSRVLEELSKTGTGTSKDSSAGATGLQPSSAAADSRLRKGASDLSASSTEFGTDSEWIKVDDDE